MPDKISTFVVICCGAQIIPTKIWHLRLQKFGTMCKSSAKPQKMRGPLVVQKVDILRMRKTNNCIRNGRIVRV